MAAFLSGATADGFRPATNAIVEPEQRPQTYSAMFWATKLGFLVAALTGGALSSIGWSWLFTVDTVSCVLFGVLVWSRIPETRPQRSAQDLELSFRDVVRDRLLLVMATLFLTQGVLWAACGGLGLLGCALGYATDGPLRRRLSPGSPRPA